MRHSPLPLRPMAAALASTLALACGESTSPTPPPTEAAPPSLAAASVGHFTDVFFDVIPDASTGLTAVIGISAEQLALACAGESFTQDQVRIVEVTRPDGSIKLTLHGNDLTVLVYSGTITDVCELAGRTPLATGRAKATQTDNDFFISGNRTNSYGLSVVGRATSDETGAHFLVRDQFRAQFPKQGGFRLLRVEFSVRPVGS